MTVANAASTVKTVADPNAEYDSLKGLWNRSRAVCSGERFVKDFDTVIDKVSFSNLLLPFSPSMTQEQYNFYKAEAELPGIVSQFAKMVVGGLLRKQPTLTLPKEVPEGASDWIMTMLGEDDSSLAAFMDLALWEELQTSRAWVYVDHPTVNDSDGLTKAERDEIRPYPVLWRAESVINWQVGVTATGKRKLTRVISRGYKEEQEVDEFHPKFVDTVWVHELDEGGKYQIRIFQKRAPTPEIPVIAGQTYTNYSGGAGDIFEEVETITEILRNGERLEAIPAWPLNGSIDAVEPILSPIIDKEIALYNKISRRNHLLYGAATYTPVLMSDMGDDEFETIVGAGLGSWLKIRADDKLDVMKTPTDALQDMDRAIEGAIEEMAKLGIRMLSPEAAQSGVALEIRNAAQTAQLGTLNNKVSNTIAQVIQFMLNWHYDLDLKISDVEFSLSADFNPIPLGADWLRLATEWYETGLIPRSTWLQILKHNDMVPPDYDDEEGVKEINDDEIILSAKDEADALLEMKQNQNVGTN